MGASWLGMQPTTAPYDRAAHPISQLVVGTSSRLVGRNQPELNGGQDGGDEVGDGVLILTLPRHAILLPKGTRLVGPHEVVEGSSRREDGLVDGGQVAHQRVGGDGIEEPLTRGDKRPTRGEESRIDEY